MTLLLLVCFQLDATLQFFLRRTARRSPHRALVPDCSLPWNGSAILVMRSISVRRFEPETLAFSSRRRLFSVVDYPRRMAWGGTVSLFLAALALFFALGVWLRDLHRVRAMRWPMAFCRARLSRAQSAAEQKRSGAQKNWLSIAGQTLSPRNLSRLLTSTRARRRSAVCSGGATLSCLSPSPPCAWARWRS